MIITMFEAITTWYVMPLIILIVLMALRFIKKGLKSYWPSKLRIIDIITFVLIFGIHGLSIELFGLSALPFLAFAASAYGLILTITLVYSEDDFRFKRFVLYYWRAIDIFVLVLYVILFLVKLANFLGIM